MSPESDGLPPPPRTNLEPSDYQSMPDLRPGTTKDSLYWVRSGAELRTGPWRDAVEMRAQVGGDPTFVPFRGTGADAFGDVQSQLERVMFGDTVDTGYSGILRALGGGMFATLTSPISTVTDQYQVGRIRELQQEFFKNNADILVELSDKMDTAKRLMREIADMMRPVGLDARKIADLVERKRRVGNATLEKINDTLIRTTDPTERKRLQGVKDEMTRWMAERNARIAAEKDEVRDLTGRLNGLDAELYRQQGQMEKAAHSESPRTDTSGRGTADFKVIATTHTQPDAMVHAASLKDLLLNSKIGFDQYIAS
jgi:hypothetical protein